MILWLQKMVAIPCVIIPLFTVEHKMSSKKTMETYTYNEKRTYRLDEVRFCGKL